MNDSFYNYHPFINMLYFTVVMTLTMFIMHPVCLAVSMVCASGYALYIGGRKTLKTGLKFALPMLILTALINPAFNHEGGTILTYLPSGNPLTLESITYGIAAAIMLITLITWFSCFNSVMTSDKFVYLFGRVIPALSLVLGMSLRFVPRFRAQIKVISNAQRCVGRDVSNGGLVRRARHGIKILSILITWALENAIEISDSMKSRGYGLPGRTAFSIFRFDKRDAKALAFILACGTYVLTGIKLHGLYYRYFPTMKVLWGGAYTVSVFAVYLLLFSLPVILNVWEDNKWKKIQMSIQSKT